MWITLVLFSVIVYTIDRSVRETDAGSRSPDTKTSAKLRTPSPVPLTH